MSPEDTVEKIRRELELIKASYQNIEKELEEYKHILYGNGRQGLLTRVALIEDKLADMDRKLDETESLIKEINKKVSNSTMKTMLYILTAVSIFNGFIATLIALKI